MEQEVLNLDNSNNDSADPQVPVRDENKPEQQEENSKAPRFLSWLLVVASLVVIFLVIIRWCLAAPLWLYIALVVLFLALLILNYINRKRRNLGWLFSLLLILMPVLVFIISAPWTWWMWLGLIVLYFVTLLTYFIGRLAESYWWVSVPLALFFLLMLLILQLSC